MNFADMTPEERAYYEKIKKRNDSMNWALKNLAIVAGLVLIATLIMLFA